MFHLQSKLLIQADRDEIAEEDAMLTLTPKARQEHLLVKFGEVEYLVEDIDPLVPLLALALFLPTRGEI